MEKFSFLFIIIFNLKNIKSLISISFVYLFGKIKNV